MSQTWNPPSGSTVLATAVKTDLVAMAEALRSLHSGASAPTSTVAYMLWADTGTGLLRQRNSSNTGWVAIAPLGADLASFSVAIELGDLAAGKSIFLPVPKAAATIQRVVLLSAAATAGSSAGVTEWTFNLTNLTQAEELFAADPGTATVNEVGGGEIAANSPYVLTPDQNATVTAGDVLELAISRTGSPTNLTQVLVTVDLSLVA